MERLGRHHPLLRRIRTLRRDRQAREGEGLFLAEGLHLAEEALARRAAIRQALVTEDLARRPEGARILHRLRAAGVPLCEVSARVMQGLQDARAPQGITLLVERPQEPDEMAAPRLAVVVDAVQEPGNLGAVLRTAHAAGADAFLVLEDSVDPFHPRAVRASQGAVFDLIPRRRSVPGLWSWIEHWGLRTVALDPRGSLSYDRCDLVSPCALILGSEARGLTPDVARRVSESVRIPMQRGVESLSVAAAAAVILFEATRQQRAADDRAERSPRSD